MRNTLSSVGNQAFADGARRGRDGSGSLGRRVQQQAAQQAADGVAPGGDAEIEHPGGVAGEPEAARRALRLLDQAGLADARLAAQQHRLAVARLGDGADQGPQLAQLADAADERALLSRPSPFRPSSRHACTGAATPLTASTAGVLTSSLPPSSARTAGEIRTSPAAAASVRREARFTVSPVTV